MRDITPILSIINSLIARRSFGSFAAMHIACIPAHRDPKRFAPDAEVVIRTELPNVPPRRSDFWLMLKREFEGRKMPYRVEAVNPHAIAIYRA